MRFLSPLKDKYWSVPYIFRGHGRASYVLAPTALRTHGPIAAGKMLGVYDPQARQVDYEIELIRLFLRGCDASGIAVPGDSPDAREQLGMESVKKLDGSHKDSWPPKALWPMLATAQHHGVPTCLLDWTRRSYVAAYFAASTALTDPGDEHLAVWALNVSDSANWKSLRYLQMPGATSQNLAAQDGVFTVSTLSATFGGGNDSTTVDRLEDVVARASQPKPILIKALLPRSQAPYLLKLCAEFGVKGSTLFPGYQGVAREVTDQAYSGIDLQSQWTEAALAEGLVPK